MFDFIKDAGAKVLGKQTSSEKEAEAEAKEKMHEAAEKTKAAAASRSEGREKLAEFKKSNELEAYVREMGLEVSGLDVKYDDGTAVIKGEAADQSTKERTVLAVGNVEGVGRVDDSMTVGNPEPESVFYTVVKGDSLSKIAKAQYGDGSKYPTIFEANKPMLKDPDLIYPGQVLRIPALDA